MTETIHHQGVSNEDLRPQLVPQLDSQLDEVGVKLEVKLGSKNNKSGTRA
jgi:hypothetical protein